MRIDLVVYAILLVFALAVVAFIAHRRIPRKLKTTKYAARWKELQSFCRDKATWPDALQAADALLDAALKKRRLKGKTMGERMVSAQRMISNNDAMWFAHNLTKKVLSEPTTRLREADVKAALLGYRSALKDIGAFEVQKPNNQTDEAPQSEQKHE